MFLKVCFFLYFLDLVPECVGICNNPCSVTGWGSWSSCHANGTQTRDKLYCCPKGITSIDLCLKNCSITPESPVVQSCVYTDSRTLTTQAGLVTLGRNGTSLSSQLSAGKVKDESGTGGGVIAGAVIGVLAIAGLSGLLAFFLYRRWKKKKEDMKVQPEDGEGNPDMNPTNQKAPASTRLN